MATTTICFFCKKNDAECRAIFQDIKHCIMPTSKKSAKSVLQHLGNLIKIKLIFQSDTSLCEFCITELKFYDRLMVKLLEHQKKLTSQLQSTLFTFHHNNDQACGASASSAAASQYIEVDDDDGGGVKGGECIQIDDVIVIEGLDENAAAMEVTTSSENVTMNDPDLHPQADEFSDNEMSEASSFHGNGDSIDSFEGLSNTTTTTTTTVSPATKFRPPQQCTECSEVFKTKRLLMEHVNKFHNQNVFECPICKVAKKDKEHLELHMNIHEGKTELECRYCDRTFTRSVNTIRHMRKHWNRLDFQCEKCGQLFAQDCLLYNHKLVHEAEENPLICEQCNQSFKSRKTFKHHLMTHRSDRPRYGCLHCSKSFTERYTLKVHMQIHGETLPYLKGGTAAQRKQVKENFEPEEEVEETSETIENLLKDKEIVEYACTICDYRFINRNQLNKHLESVHDAIIN